MRLGSSRSAGSWASVRMPSGSDGEDAVAAVHRAAHDEVVHGVLAHHDAAARVGVVLPAVRRGLARAFPFSSGSSDVAATGTLSASALRRVGSLPRPTQLKRASPSCEKACPDGRRDMRAAPPWFPTRTRQSQRVRFEKAGYHGKSRPAKERSSFSHGFSVGGARAGQSGYSRPRLFSWRACEPLRCSAACSARPPARPTMAMASSAGVFAPKLEPDGPLHAIPIGLGDARVDDEVVHRRVLPRAPHHAHVVHPVLQRPDAAFRVEHMPAREHAHIVLRDAPACWPARRNCPHAA